MLGNPTPNELRRLLGQHGFVQTAKLLGIRHRRVRELAIEQGIPVPRGRPRTQERILRDQRIRSLRGTMSAVELARMYKLSVGRIHQICRPKTPQ